MHEEEQHFRFSQMRELIICKAWTDYLKKIVVPKTVEKLLNMEGMIKAVLGVRMLGKRGIGRKRVGCIDSAKDLIVNGGSIWKGRQ